MVVLEEELWRLSFVVLERHHAAITLEVEPTVLTEDGLVWTSVVPVSGGLGETMATGVVAVSEREGARKVKFADEKILWFGSKFGEITKYRS
ncbi:MAG: hypothetical protein MJE68_03930 [Proteobacteria bacterium]|nr:hypothetical protein [Pseudomonadota bacterium]